MTEVDLSHVVQYLLSRGCTLVADMRYSEAKAFTIQKYSNFRDCRDTYRSNLYFVLHSSWQVAPLEFGRYTKDGKQLYYIKQKVAGPTIDIFAPFENRKTQPATIPHGFIGYHTRYWNPSTGDNDPAPEILKTVYRETVKHLRQGAEVRKSSKSRYLVAKDARRRLEGGAALGPPLGGD